MSNSLENSESLSQRLRHLNEVNIALTKAPSVDELFCQAVEFGRDKLGFDRLAIFLATERPHFYIPTFGTDEDGNTRDERTTEPIGWDTSNDVSQAIMTHQRSFAREGVDLRNHNGEIVGRGWHAIAMLWDGDDIIGWMTADNLINQRPLSHHDIEILELYGVNLGHLYSRKLAEEALIAERNLLRTIIDNTLDYIYVKDIDSRFTLVNRPFYLKDRNPSTTREDDIIGKSDFDFYPEYLARQYYEEEQQVLHQGVAIRNKEEIQVGGSGEQVCLLTTKVPLRDQQGRIIGLAGVSRDITDIKHSEQSNYDLQLQRERTALMDELVQNLSHDLKTSLSIISVSMHLVSRLEDPARQKDKIETIKRQIQRLERIIHNTLYLSRLHIADETTALPVNLNQTLNDLVNVSQTQIDAKALTVSFDLDPSQPTLLSYNASITRMLSNLLENAIVYSHDHGRINIHTAVHNEEVHIVISDNGIGMNQEALERIFEPFYRADPARSVDSGGAGLGLAIVKQVVARHHGKIDIESIEHQGTTVWVSFPYRVRK